jgi:hypothetical protein
MSAQSIQSIFTARGSADLESRLSEARSSDALRELVHLLKVPLAGYAGAAGDLAKALWDLLDLDIADILVKTWNEAGILKKYLNPTEYDPSAEVSVTLSEHKIKSEHHPYVDILLDGVKLLRVVLDINLEFGFDGIVVKIKNARITEIRTGSCKAKGTVSYKGLDLFKQESGRLDLPGSLSFEKGIPIAP